MLPSDAELNVATMRAVLGSGHSRIPVHRPGNRHAAICCFCSLSVHQVLVGSKLPGPTSTTWQFMYLRWKPQSSSLVASEVLPWFGTSAAGISITHGTV